MTQVVVCGRGRAGRGGVGEGGDRQLSVLVSWSACAQLSPYAIGGGGGVSLNQPIVGGWILLSVHEFLIE